MHEDDIVVDDDDDLLPPRPAPPLTWRDVVDRVVAPDGATRLRAVGALVLLALVAAAAWWVLRPPPAPATELSLPFAPSSGAAGPVSSTATTTGEIVVHAAGAVAAPGLHRLPAGARVADLLAAAGGPAGDADLDRVNLAAPVGDGERVWFPRVGEASPPPVEGAAPPSAGGEPAVVDLNTATAADLESLPGIGPSIAAAIIEHRERSGPFRSVDELLDVPGIGPARLEELRPFVTV